MGSAKIYLDQLAKTVVFFLNKVQIHVINVIV